MRLFETIEALTSAQGGVMFFQSGGCCDGSSPICHPEGELPISPHHLLLGHVGGVVRDHPELVMRCVRGEPSQ